MAAHIFQRCASLASDPTNKISGPDSVYRFSVDAELIVLTKRCRMDDLAFDWFINIQMGLTQDTDLLFNKNKSMRTNKCELHKSKSRIFYGQKVIS